MKDFYDQLNAIGNYSYIDDVILGHIQAMETGKKGESYILGGENLSFNEFFDKHFPILIFQLQGGKSHKILCISKLYGILALGAV